MSSRIAQPVELAVDVSAVLPFADETNTLSATVHVPSPEHGPPRAVLVCWPGGSYSRAYWDMHIPGHRGYSFAEHMTDRGFVVIAVDPLGAGASSRPSEVDAVNLQTMAAAAAEFVRQLRTLMAVGELASRLAPLEDVPLVAVGHSLGGCLAIVEQALHGSYDAVANLGSRTAARTASRAVRRVAHPRTPRPRCARPLTRRRPSSPRNGRRATAWRRAVSITVGCMRPTFRLRSSRPTTSRPARGLGSPTSVRCWPATRRPMPRA